MVKGWMGWGWMDEVGAENLLYAVDNHTAKRLMIPREIQKGNFAIAQ